MKRSDKKNRIKFTMGFGYTDYDGYYEHTCGFQMVCYDCLARSEFSDDLEGNFEDIHEWKDKHKCGNEK